MGDQGILGFSSAGVAREVAAAASVILVREEAGFPWEVFLLKRRQEQKFMGGAHVFPGGRLDKTDGEASWEPFLCRKDRRDREELGDTSLAEEQVRGILIAAIRETFEEAGILLACTAEGKPWGPVTCKAKERLHQWRQQVRQGETPFRELFVKENLRLDFRQLFFYAHWLTPEIEARRFDTRFFLACLPAHQEASHDGAETSASGWFAPQEALYAQERGEIILMPPTLKILEDLSCFARLKEVFRQPSSGSIPRILPEVILRDGQVGVIFPNDCEYGNPGCRRPGRPGETSRVLLIDGRWVRQSRIS
jgi:8-oxo-dGTP pyrophosphatase MutT (NUDIX family)